MNVLLVDVPADLGTAIRRALGPGQVVTDSTTDLLDPDATSGSGYDVVIHALGQGDSAEDRLLRSTLGTWNLLAPMSRGRYLQLSTMEVMAGYDDGWDVREHWLPRPALDAVTMACHLGELAGQELTRTRAVATRVLRLDEPVANGAPVGPREITVDDAAAAVALACRDESAGPRTWLPYHVVNGGGRYRPGALAKVGFAPTPYDGVVTPQPPRLPANPGPLTDLATPRRLTVYGAGGPMGAATVALLLDRDLVRATDVANLSTLAARPPQGPGVPTLTALPKPHEFRSVDVADPDQVRAAAAGSDCLINVSVMRNDPVTAFRVNVLGAWTIMQAAITESVPRVVFTGPTMAIAPYPLSSWDRALDGTQAFRTDGRWVYMISKLLATELTRLLAEQHRIATPMLLWYGFVTEDQLHGRTPSVDIDFLVTWPDAGRAVVAAADVARLPEPAPVINILAPSPTGRWTTDRASTILGFDAVDDLQHLWWDPRVAQG